MLGVGLVFGLFEGVSEFDVGDCGEAEGVGIVF